MRQDQTGGDLDGSSPVQYLKGSYWKVFATVAGAHCKHRDSAIALIVQSL